MSLNILPNVFSLGGNRKELISLSLIHIYSEGKQSVKTEKLHVSERVKYEIYRAVKEALRSANTWKEFQSKLLKMGVEMEFKYKGCLLYTSPTRRLAATWKSCPISWKRWRRKYAMPYEEMVFMKDVYKRQMLFSPANPPPK